MKIGSIVLLLPIGFIFNVQAQEQWTQQTSGTTKTLNSVFCADSNHCFTVGSSSSILETKNGGITWTTALGFGANAIYCLDTNICYAAGGGVGSIRKTTNEGSTWSETNGSVNDLNSVYFVDSNTGWAVGVQGTIIKTTNGGVTWTAQTSGTTQPLESVYFMNTTLGYAGGGSGASRILLKTTNGGTSWNALTISGNTYINSIRFFTSNIGYVVGWGRDLLKTTDGGLTWISHTIPGLPKTSGYCLDTNVCYATGLGSAPNTPGDLYETTDGGATWVNANVSNIGLNSVYFVSASIGYAVGYNGIIWKHTGLPVPILATKLAVKSFGFIRNEILEYNLSKPSRVQILLFDLKGRQSPRLVDGIEQVGDHTLILPVHGATGLQILDFRADGEHKTMKMVGNQ